jgi:hypothetical protein
MRLEGGTYIVYLPAQGIHISRDECLLAGVGIEIAVSTAMGAEGDMEVERIRMFHLSELGHLIRQACECQQGLFYP